MAISITNAQGSKLYICATAAADVSSVVNIGTAITAGDQVGCLQDIGSIATTRSVQEYTCLSSDETTKSTGSLSAGNFTVGMLFDAVDTTGQAELRAMYSANETRTMIIALSDDGATSPTYITFEGFVSGQDISVQKDSAVMINSTVEIASAILITEAT